MKAIVNGRVIVPGRDGHFRVMENCTVLYDKRIEGVVPAAEAAARTDVQDVLDAEGRYVSPGFINIHIHGCGGADAMDESAEALPLMQRLQAQTGVTSFLPTTMTYDFPRLYRAFARVREAMRKPLVGARVLGCHMEGPFISEAYKGAQAAVDIAAADFSRVEEWSDVVRIVTLAPEELKGDYRFVEQCRERGILVSIGHSAADYEEAFRAITRHGMRHITHLFNAMTGLHHRRPGIVGAAFDTDAVCELIADNVHVHPAAQRIVYAVKGGENIVLITDSMRACMLGDGESELGGQKVFVKGQKATLADGTIAGSVLTMDRAIHNFTVNTGASLQAVVELVTRIPAEELGEDLNYGRIALGCAADFALFDEDIHIFVTIVDGKIVYRKG